MAQVPVEVEPLAERLRQHAERLNALRVPQEARPTSRVPVLGPLLNLLRRLANRLATRWYLLPVVEQQARFSQEVTAAFDDLAAVLVEQAQRLAERERQRQEIAPPPPPEWERLAALSGEDLRAFEDADLPALEECSDRPDLAKWYDEENALSFPLLWFNQLHGWHYLFHLTILGVALDLRPGDIVLDLAGASGWVSEYLSRFGVRTVLLDCVEDLLHTSRVRFGLDRRLEKGAPNHPVAGDALHLPFADGSFDGVICMNALHHMPSYEVTLCELHRVLKPGRRAVFGEPGEKHAQSPLSQQAMREYGALEKNMPLPLIYVLARRAGFERMVRYPYLHPEVMEYAYPEESATVPAVLERMAQFLPDWLRGLSLFALQKAGQEPPTSNLSPLQQARHKLLAELTLLEHREQVPAGSPFVARVRARNTGDVIWLAEPRPYGGHVRLGVKLCDAGGRLLREDLASVLLPHDVAPGEQVELEVTVPAPGEGKYRLRYDLVSEARSWFELLGSAVLEHKLEVL